MKAVRHQEILLDGQMKDNAAKRPVISKSHRSLCDTK